MPVISRFFGVVIYMYWRDHVPPHFHARYQDREELLEDWKLAEQKRMLKRIEPLE